VETYAAGSTIRVFQTQIEMSAIWKRRRQESNPLRTVDPP
jgi:hypothetical protein